MLTAKTIPLLAALFLCSAAYAQFGTKPNGRTRFSTVAKGTHSQITRASLYRFTDDASLRKHYQQHGLSGEVPAKQNWKEDQIVVIHLGQRNTGGYSVELGTVQRRRADRARIVAVEITPARGAMTTQALTSPYVVLAIDRSITRFDLAWKKREAKPPR